MTASGDASDIVGIPWRRLRNLGKKLDAALESALKKAQFLGHWRVSLLTTITVLLIVIGARYWYSFVTGFILPDEAWYYDVFLLDRAQIPQYREVFVAIFLLFFHDVNSVWAFLLRGALYSAIWGVGCVVLFFVILRKLKVPEKISSLLILSLPLFPVFTILTAGVLTETPGLFMTMLAVYFALRHIQEGRMINSLASGIFFVLAYKIREPYLLFAVGNLLFFLALSLKRRSPRSIIGYAIPVSLVFPVPTQIGTLQFAQPIYVIINVASRFLSWGSQTNSAASSATGQGVTPTLAMPILPITAALSPDLPKAIAVGLGYGFNPLFALFAALSLLALGFELLRRRSSTTLLLALNAVWSFGAFVIPVTFVLLTSTISVWMSLIVRTAHPALPCIFGFPAVYRRLKVKRVAALILVLLILGSTQISSLTGAFERSLSLEPVDRLTLDYRAPYYRMYLLAKDSGKVIVFGGAHMRGIRMYMAMLPNVDLERVGARGRPNAMNETRFRTLLAQGWDSIFLYDDWVTLAIPSFAGVYPEFYTNLLLSRQYPGYSIETLWIDGESYALKMVRDTSASSGLPPSLPMAHGPTSPTPVMQVRERMTLPIVATRDRSALLVCRNVNGT